MGLTLGLLPIVGPAPNRLGSSFFSGKVTRKAAVRAQIRREIL
jgi:hypothetical protein